MQPEKLNLGAVGGRIGIPALFIGVLALGVAAWLGFRGDPASAEVTTLSVKHFYHSYLAAFAFFMAITLGALVFVLIHHLARAAWSTTVRRLAEGLALNMFLMVVLLIPLLKGLDVVLPWLHESDPILKSKSGYLNWDFFRIRIVLYFGLWCFLAWYYSAKSASQDQSGDKGISWKMERLGPPAVILFGFSLTAFAIDWVMALNAHWFSTMFGVYFFAGAFLSAVATIILLAQTLQSRGLIGNVISDEHYHDLGKWMFAFTFFWGYIAFSQYMLIWYANLPEETQFYICRQIGTWCVLSLVLLFVHLLIPFPGLLSRHVKRRRMVLSFWAVWTLCACALDVYWLVVPNQWINEVPKAVQHAGYPEMPLSSALPELLAPGNIYELNKANEAFAEKLNFPFHGTSILVTVLCFVGIGGLYVFSTMLALRGKSLVPLKDPRLNESLAFENI